MRRIFVKEKTGFKVVDPTQPVIIRDARGILFYSTESQVPNVTCFNLPGFGEYFVEGNIKPLDEPVEYALADIPVPLAPRFPPPFDYQIVFGVNPNKCTVKWDKGVILFDNAFKDKPLPQVFFILYHEYAHAYFEEETLCDQLAGNYMKIRGFNPSQIVTAPILALSARQKQRKINMVESIKSAL